jgi:hypothetical protein
MVMITVMVVDLGVVSGAFLAPRLVAWSVDMSDKGVLQVVWALFLCDGNRQLLK